jgi:DNA-binding GntR family transcriptional regulator
MQHEKSKKMTVYEHLKERIVNDLLKPSEALNEKVLAQELKISKTPIREALQQLEKEGFVENIRNKGCFVSRISVHDIRELYEIREILECSAARVAALNADRDRAKYESYQFKNKNNIKNILQTGEQIHRTIIESLHNHRLMGIYTGLQDHAKRLGMHFAIQYGQGRVEESAKEHKEILKAILAKDPSRAQEAMRTHIRHSMERLKEIIYSNSLWDK